MSSIQEKADIGMLYHDLREYGAFNGNGEHQVKVVLTSHDGKSSITAEFLVKCHPAPTWEIEITHLGPYAMSSGPFIKIVSTEYVIPQGYTFDTIKNVLWTVRSNILERAARIVAEAEKS